MMIIIHPLSFIIHDKLVINLNFQRRRLKHNRIFSFNWFTGFTERYLKTKKSWFGLIIIDFGLNIFFFDLLRFWSNSKCSHISSTNFFKFFLIFLFFRLVLVRRTLIIRSDKDWKLKKMKFDCVLSLSSSSLFFAIETRLDKNHPSFFFDNVDDGSYFLNLYKKKWQKIVTFFPTKSKVKPI